MVQRGSFDLILIQRLGVIVDVGQRRRERNLARPVRGAGEGRRGGRTTKSTTTNLLVPVASPGAAPIAVSLLLQRRRAPVKFRRGGARLAPGMGWHDQ